MLEPDAPPIGLRTHRALYEELLTHLLAVVPLEAVGLLGCVAEGEWSRAVSFYPGDNVDASTTRYTMDPAAVLGAFRVMGGRGQRFGASVHSHPASQPVPSATDLRECHYPDALLVIVSLMEPAPSSRCWRIVFDEEGQRAESAVELLFVVDEDYEDSPNRKVLDDN